MERKGTKSTGESRLMPIKRTFLNLLCALHHAARRDARILPRRNNRSFNSDAGGLSLSPVKPADPAPVSSSLTFAPLFCFLFLSWRALYYRRGDDLQNEPSVWLAPEAPRERRRRGVYQVYELNCRFITLEGRGRGQGWGSLAHPLSPPVVRRAGQDSVLGMKL